MVVKYQLLFLDLILPNPNHTTLKIHFLSISSTIVTMNNTLNLPIRSIPSTTVTMNSTFDLPIRTAKRKREQPNPAIKKEQPAPIRTIKREVAMPTIKTESTIRDVPMIDNEPATQSELTVKTERTVKAEPSEQASIDPLRNVEQDRVNLTNADRERNDAERKRVEEYDRELRAAAFWWI